MPVINLPGQWDVFISHSQRDANATTLAVELYFSLKERGLAVWLDVKMSKRDEAAMEEGAKNSTMVVAIVTDGGGVEENAFFRRDFCLQELRWAKSAGAAIQPIIRVDDKKRVGEFINGAPDDLKDIGKVDWVHLDRGAVQYWDVGMDILVQRLDEANVKEKQIRTADDGDDEALDHEVSSLLTELRLTKYEKKFIEQGVRSKADLEYVDEQALDEIGLTRVETNKFIRQKTRLFEPSVSDVKRGAAAMESWKKKRGGRERWKTLAQMHHAIKSFQVVLNKSAAHEEQNEPQPVRPKLGDLNMFVNDASGVTSDDVDAWGESDMDMFVKIEVQSKTAGVKSLKQATSTVTADGVRATWKEKLVLPVHDGTEELRVILCKNKKGGFNTGVVAAAAIYVQDILRAVPIDKHFQLFKPGEGGDAGFIRLAMNFRQQAMARESAKTSTGSKAAIESIKEAEGRNNVHAIIETMKLNVADADVQAQACWALRSLSADNSENKSRISQAGGIEAVLRAIKRHEDHAGVQESACRALCNLSNHPENKSRIGQAGGIEAVLSAMKGHENHADVQEHACWALRNLSGNHPENQSRIAQAGGIEAVLSAMKGHENRAGVQEHACVVFFLTSRNAECKRHAIDAGAIPAIEAARRNHPNSNGVQTEAADALGRLGS